MASEPLKVFISYNQADRDWAEWIAGVIERAVINPSSKRGIRPGENFVLRMQQATNRSGHHHFGVVERLPRGAVSPLSR